MYPLTPTVADLLIKARQRQLENRPRGLEDLLDCDTLRPRHASWLAQLRHRLNLEGTRLHKAA